MFNIEKTKNIYMDCRLVDFKCQLLVKKYVNNVVNNLGVHCNNCLEIAYV